MLAGPAPPLVARQSALRGVVRRLRFSARSPRRSPLAPPILLASGPRLGAAAGASRQRRFQHSSSPLSLSEFRADCDLLAVVVVPLIVPPSGTIIDPLEMFERQVRLGQQVGTMNEERCIHHRFIVHRSSFLFLSVSFPERL